MSSIVPGYEYDIFISYRQKDNKYDGWVTEFVNNLKKELEATFKEEINVYFDINPHDGLLETHDVDESLKDKLKCLVFIPIISRTYCDPKSFAWEHEFKAFVDLASQDQFGIKVKLPNGNVANRVLPIRIHDLDIADIKLCDSVLGGVLRGIEFIYKESGFNRPLKPDDDEKTNLNKTKYRNQIAKVALAIKEIIISIGQKEQVHEEVRKEVFKPISIPRNNTKNIIIAGSTILLALIILGVFFIPKLFKAEEQLEKSIALMPFVNDSPDQENTYFINGIMDEILNNLQKIKDFRVLSRTSTEQYRGTNKPPIPKIAQELDVNYIVEGSGQKYGNTFRLRVQLIEANHDRHLWAESYDQEIKEVKDIFGIQSQIAQEIAKVLKVIITPEEKQLIEKVPTANLTAYDYYLRGFQELWKFGLTVNNPESTKRAEILFKKALEIDSAFALGYVGLAHICWRRAYSEKELSKNSLDSMLILANIALSFNDQLAEAFSVRGGYYREKGDTKKAVEEYDKAIKVNPNCWEAYHGKGWLPVGGFISQIENLLKATSLNRGAELMELLTIDGDMFAQTGFPEKAKVYYLEALNLHGDSIKYLCDLFWLEYWQGNYEKSLEFLEKINAKDSAYVGLDNKFALAYIYTGQYERSLKYLEKWVASGSPIFNTYDMSDIGYIYWVNGNKKKAEYYFDKQVEYCLESLKRVGPDVLNINLSANLTLAAVYAFKGDKDRAFEGLKIFSQQQIIELWMVTFMSNYPLFNSIRDEPEFQKIVSEMKAKYQAEHERVRKWLEEQGKL
jgi:TolB-like protein